MPRSASILPAREGRLTAGADTPYHHRVRGKVLHYIREHGLLQPGDRVAVAVSGGADSVALLRVLLELRSELGVVLAVAHFNHQLRGGDSEADEHFVAELAGRNDLPFFSARRDVGEYARIHKLNLEHSARDLRYRWLERLAMEQEFDAIATGHTANDQAETVLMKLLRGAGTRGLGSISPVLMLEHRPVVRPLLEVSRPQIESYLAAIGERWREDHTNRDHKLTRNRIRHKLLPLLERDYNSDILRLLSQTAEIARDEEDFWRDYSKMLVNRWHRRAHGLRLREPEGSGFEFSAVAVQRRALKHFLAEYGVAADFQHVEKVRHCALGDGSIVNLPGGWRAKRDGAWLKLLPAVPDGTEPASSHRYQYRLPIPGRCLISETGITLEATLVPAAAAALEPPGTLLPSAVLGPEVIIRNWQPGDRFRPAHTGVEEKLKRLFSEEHIPADQRPLWPVVLSGQQIVWVRGFPVAHDSAWLPGSGEAVRIEVVEGFGRAQAKSSLSSL